MEGTYRFDFKKRLSLPTGILRILGLWSTTEDKFFSISLYTAYTIVVLAMCAIHYLFQVAYLFVGTGDLEVKTLSAVTVFEEIITHVKVFAIIKNQQSLKQFVENCNNDIFQPINLKQRDLAKETMNQSKWFYVVFATVATSSVITYSFYPLVDYSKQELNLPYIAWHPYNETKYFTATYFHQAISMFYIAQTHITIDGFAAYLIGIIVVQCDLLSDSIRFLKEYTTNELQIHQHEMEPDEFSRALNQALYKRIEHHKEILLHFSALYNTLNLAVFAQYVAATISICLTLLQTTLIAPTDPKFITVIIFEMTILSQLFLYCWWGSELLNKSEQLPYAAFESDWIGTSPSCKQNLLIFVHRTQTPLILYAVDYFKVSLQSFMMILRHAYSFYAVLRRMN